MTDACRVFNGLKNFCNKESVLSFTAEQAGQGVHVMLSFFVVTPKQNGRGEDEDEDENVDTEPLGESNDSSTEVVASDESSGHEVVQEVCGAAFKCGSLSCYL